MAGGNTIKNFSAADIEKYHQGLLSNQEMHELEKAALEDPFLADAMEGYSVEGIKPAADIAELKKRLAEKQEETKIIPIAPASSSRTWLRAAAMIIAVAGAGLLVYQFAFNNNKNNIAQSNETAKPAALKRDSGTGIIVNADTTVMHSETPAVLNKATGEKTTSSNTSSTPQGLLENQAATTDDNTSAKETAAPPVLVETKDEKAEVLPVPSVADNNSFKRQNQDQEIARRNVSIADKSKARANPGAYRNESQDSSYQAMVSANNARFNNTMGYMNQQNNVFRGRVTDLQNNALPFANITNPVDNVGTYADANGNFILTSPDSILNVQVRSIGFENNTAQLRNNLPDNQILLQEDRSLNARVLDTSKRVANRSRQDNRLFEEPEPADGWLNYDTYVANNLKLPEEYKTRSEGKAAVELSFEVNSIGQPVNIKVVKSLCSSCDQEAIRLIKEGPKWKRKSGKKRTTVTVSF